MITKIKFNPQKLVVVLFALVVTGCCHVSHQNRVAVPNKDFPYSFDKAPFISPRIIQDLSTWISDHGDQVVAINVLKSQSSNRHFGDVLIQTNAGSNPWVSTETTTVEYGETNHASFAYQFVGMTSSGIYVLATADWQGGSGIFKNLLLVTFEYDDGIRCDWDKEVIRHADKRLLVKKLGEIPLGDRWNGNLRIQGENIFVGKDHGWFAVTGGTGGGELTYEQKEHVLKINLDR